MGSAGQQGVDIQRPALPDLQMHLTKSGHLIAKPVVTKIRIGVDSGRFHV
jgi:hypothetical protein